MISHKDVSEELRIITLSGRLDILGTEEIAQEFTALSMTAKRCVIVDLSELKSLASIGIRALISNGKGFQKLGRRMALVVGDNVIVAKALETTGISVLLKMCKTLSEAERLLLNSRRQ
jgi:anti-sigma B factor antagonist